jgi:negative regulator of flagellin synthesis FlgM
MHVHGPTHIHGPQSIGPPHGMRGVPPSALPEKTSAADSVEISDAARMLDQARDIPEVRQDRIDAIRNEIAAGTYETEEKLNIAIERLLDEIG